MTNRFKIQCGTILFLALTPFLSCNSGNDITANDSAADTTISTPIANDTPVAKTIQDTAAVNLIKAVLINDLIKNDLSILTENDRRFIFSEADLNNDEKNEIFVSMKGNYFCGNAGCTVYLLTIEGKKITTFTIVDGPITVSTGKTKGWNDLITPSRGINYLVKYNGRNYPSNPSVQPKFTGTVTDDMQKVLPDNSTLYTF